MIQVGIVMGSNSDWDVMQNAAKMLQDFGVAFEARVVSAHRTPDLLYEYAESAAGRGLQAIIAGAGGAAHGILPALVDAAVGEIIVVNRDEAKANKLADRCGLPGRVNTRRVEQLKDVGSFDLIINTISDDPVNAFNLTGDLMAPRALVVDLNYGARASHLKAWSQVHNAPLFVDGLAMLIEQAAESFAIWHNSTPDTAPVYELLEGK